MARPFDFRQFGRDYKAAARRQWNGTTRETITFLLWGLVALGLFGVWRSGFTWEGVGVFAAWTGLVVFWTVKAEAERRSIRHMTEVTRVDEAGLTPYYFGQCADCDWISRTYASEGEAAAAAARHGRAPRERA
jgi:hypothetical protein